MKFILIYLAVVNFISYIMYGIDKRKAKQNRWRISENSLIFVAVIGGSIGAYLGMKMFHHKTRHKKFYMGIPAIMILQLLLAIWIIYK